MAWASAYSPDCRVVSVVGAAAGTTAANDRRILEAVTNVSASNLSVDNFDTGRWVVLVNPSNGLANTFAVAKMASTPRYIGVMFRASPGATGNNATIFCTMPASTAAQSIVLRCNLTTGLLAYSFDNGSTWTNSSTTPSGIQRWEVFVDFGVSTTHTLKVRYATGTGAMTEIINTTGGSATSTGGDPTLGTPTADASQANVAFSDIVTYNDVAQYATMDDWRVLALEPVADGTHSVGAGAFKTEAAVAITGATTDAYTHVDIAPTTGAPAGATERVEQTVDDANAYLEFQLRSLTDPVSVSYGDPVLVCLTAAMYPSTTGANLSSFHLNSGGNVSAEAPIDTSIAATTLEYRKHHYTTEPTSAAAWTKAMAGAPLRARVGYTTLIPATGAWASVMAFVVVPRSTTVPSVTVARTRT